MEASERINIRPSLHALAAGVALMLALSAYAWSALPGDARIATHWNIRGEADGFSSKLLGLLLLPAITTATVLFVVALVQLDPRRRNMAQSGGFLTVSMAALILMMCAIHAAIIATALGARVPMGELVMTLTGALFIVLGNYMGKVRSNYFMGVRTPWTLSSELSWNKTNRLCGRLFLATGLLTLALAWISITAATIVLLAGILTSTLIAIIYSYLVWKHDPAKM